MLPGWGSVEPTEKEEKMEDIIRMSKRDVDMTSEQYEHILSIVRKFAFEATEKYEKGCAEHGGGLWEVPAEDILEMAIEEAIDQVVYLMTLRDKLKGG